MNNKQVQFAVMAIVALLAVLGEAEAVTCNVYELNPCASAILSSAPPSTACCVKLTEQEPCLCQYYKDPNLAKYIGSPGAKRAATACKVSTQC